MRKDSDPAGARRGGLTRSQIRRLGMRVGRRAFCGGGLAFGAAAIGLRGPALGAGAPAAPTPQFDALFAKLAARLEAVPHFSELVGLNAYDPDRARARARSQEQAAARAEAKRVLEAPG